MFVRLLSAFALAAAFAAPAAAQETLVVYWTKGFYPQEDKALDDMIAKFQQKTGVKIELSRYSPQESVPKAVAALDSGTPPDVAYGDVFDFQVAGKWAFEGQLEDLSDILAPMKDRFMPNTLETRTSSTTRRRSAPTTPSPPSARRCTSSTGRTCWPRRATRSPTCRRRGRRIGISGATRRSPAIARRAASASTPSAARWASTRATRSSPTSRSWTRTTSSWSTTTASWRSTGRK